MKILLIGSQKEWAIENYYEKYLASAGAEVALFPIHDHFYDFYYKSILNKLLFKLSPGSVYKRLNVQLLKRVRADEFDVLWVFKGMEIFPQTLKEIKSNTKVKLVNFNPDHPFQFAGKGSGNSNVLKAINLYDLHLCYHPNVMHRISHQYKVLTAYLPFGYEPADPELPSREEEIMKACFIGNPDEYRIRTLQHLIDKGIAIDIYGNDWEAGIHTGENAKIYPAIYGREFNEMVSRYRCQINIFRKHNLGAHNMRSFEMPAVGSILLTPYSENQERFWENGKEVFYYHTAEELTEQLQKVLSLPYEKSRKIRENAIIRAKHSGYNYESLARVVLDEFHKLASS